MAKKSNLKEDKDIYKFLRHDRRRLKRGNYKNLREAIKDRVPIIDCPKIVKEKTRLKYIEVVLMMVRIITLHYWLRQKEQHWTNLKKKNQKLCKNSLAKEYRE